MLRAFRKARAICYKQRYLVLQYERGLKATYVNIVLWAENLLERWELVFFFLSSMFEESVYGLCYSRIVILAGGESMFSSGNLLLDFRVLLYKCC